MDELFMLDPKLVSAFDQSERLKLHNIGRMNVGTHTAPDYACGVFYVTPERVDERGRMWIIVLIPDELTDEDLISLAPRYIDMAEERLELVTSSGS